MQSQQRQSPLNNEVILHGGMLSPALFITRADTSPPEKAARLCEGSAQYAYASQHGGVLLPPCITAPIQRRPEDHDTAVQWRGTLQREVRTLHLHLHYTFRTPHYRNYLCHNITIE